MNSKSKYTQATAIIKLFCSVDYIAPYPCVFLLQITALIYSNVYTLKALWDPLKPIPKKPKVH